MPHGTHGWLEVLLNSELVKGIIAFFGALFAAGVGIMARIADEVKMGDRRKLISRRLWLDVPALFMMTFIVIGISSYYDLPGTVAAGIGPVFGYIGPRIVDYVLAYKLRK